MSIKVSIKSLQERIWTLDEKWQGWEGGRCLVSRAFQTDEILYIRIQGESPDQGSVVTRWAGWESGREVQEGGDSCAFSPSICHESADKDHKEGWVPKTWCFQIVLEKILKSPLDCKEIKRVNPKGNQPSIFIGRTIVKAEAPKLWLPYGKSWLIGKDPDAGKDWRQKAEEKGVAGGEIVR